MKMSYGFWPLAILMIVVASWVVYHYLAPKRWREWTRVGLIQAFIIALYAEMYGFPLTIYLLTRFLKLDRKSPCLSGNLWSYLLGYGETGMMVAMVAGYALVFIGVSMLAAGWREVYRARFSTSPWRCSRRPSASRGAASGETCSFFRFPRTATMWS